jgi:hypothetical protein
LQQRNGSFRRTELADDHHNIDDFHLHFLEYGSTIEWPRDDTVWWKEVRGEGQIDDELQGGDEYTDTSFAFLTTQYDNSHDTMHSLLRHLVQLLSAIQQQLHSTLS